MPAGVREVDELLRVVEPMAGEHLDDSVLDQLKEWFGERHRQTLAEIERGRRAIETLAQTQSLHGERLAVIESKILANGGLVTRQNCELREAKQSARIDSFERKLHEHRKLTDARFAGLSKKLDLVSGRLWKFLVAFLGLFASAIVSQFLFF